MLETNWIEGVGNACGNKKVFFCTIPHDLNAKSSKYNKILNNNSNIDNFNTELKKICASKGWGIIDVGSLKVVCDDYHPTAEWKKNIASYIADVLKNSIA